MAPAALAGLSFVAQDAATDVKLTIDQSKLHHELILKADADTKDVRVAITLLNGPTTITPSCLVGATKCSDAKKFDIPKLGSAVISIDADVVPIGTYTAILTITTADSRIDRYILVTRSAGTLPVQAPAESKLQTTTGTVTVNGELRETAGLDQTLNIPRLVNLAWSSGEKTSDAKHGTIRAFVAGKEQTNPWTLRAGDTPNVSVEIEGLQEPGHYTGKIRYAAPDARAVEQAITFDLRRPRSVAVLWIALGVFISYILHLIAKARPWVAQQQTAAELVQDLEAIKTDLGKDEPEETRITQFVANQLDQIVRDLDQGKAAADGALREIDGKIRLLRKWLPERKRYRGLPNTVAAGVRKIVDDAAAALTTTGLTPDNVKVQDAALDGLDTAIKQAQDDELKLRIASLQQAVGQANLFTDANAQVQATAIRTALTNAANDVNAGRGDVARAAYESAQADYAKALAQELRTRSDPNRQIPAGYQAADWASMTTEVDGILTSADAEPAHALDLVRRALGIYLRGASKLLAYLAGQAAATIQGSGQIADAMIKADLVTRATAVQTAANGIALKIAAGNVESAAGDYGQAVQDLAAVKAAVAVYGVAMGGGGADTPDAAVAGGALSNLLVDAAVLVLPRVARVARVRRDPSFFRRLGMGLDATVLLVAFAVAIALGVKLLWEPNLTWGGTSDIVVAVLWGLGMHQVAGNTFEGFSSIMSKFGAS